MKKLLVAACIIILFFTSIGYAYWWGQVRYAETGGYVPYAAVMAWLPPGGHTTANSLGWYTLDLDNGMVEGRYYKYLEAYKGIMNGRNYVRRHYYDEENVGSIYIDIGIGTK